MSTNQKSAIVESLKLIGVERAFIIREVFLGYKFRKNKGKLYKNDREIPIMLLRLYYGLDDGKASLDTLQKEFITHYINQESKLEGLDTKSIHSKVEVEGLKVMYEYIHSEDIDYMFDVYTLKDLHKKLYSKAPFPDYAGDFRNDDRYLPGTGTDLSEWWMIRTRLNEIDVEFQRLVAEAKRIKEEGTVDELLKFIDDTVVVKCRLIKVHPFPDGNGRTIRGLINKLFEYAGLPPIYIKENERTEYHKAMNKANNEDDYDDIKQFYKYKICDSIIELDINNRVKQERQATNASGFGSELECIQFMVEKMEKQQEIMAIRESHEQSKQKKKTRKQKDNN